MKYCLKAFIFLSLVVLFSGCATPYQKYKTFPVDGGYRDLTIQDNMFKVSFIGNIYTAKDDVNNYALLRSAEMTLENGYKYFLILEGNTDERELTYTMPESYTASTIGMPATIPGQIDTQRTTIHKTGGGIYSYRMPICHLTIQCFEDKPSIDALIYNAEQVKNNLKSQYRIKQ